MKKRYKHIYKEKYMIEKHIKKYCTYKGVSQ